MSKATTLVGLLAELGGGALEIHREGDTLAVAVIAFPNGRQMLAIERTYRDGIGILLDPTPEELEIARHGDLWKLWNSDRRTLLASIV